MNRNVSIADDAALLQVNNTGPQKLNPFQYWYYAHLRAAATALGEIVLHPIANAFTLLVIALAFSLPATLFVILNNLSTVNHQWKTVPHMTFYLKQSITPTARNMLIQQLQRNPSIESVKYVSPAEGLKQLSKTTPMKDTLTALGKNPLPGVLVVTPNHLNISPDKINVLFEHLKQSAAIETASMNQAWTKRLFYIVSIIKAIAVSLAILFSVGVVLIVGNTIRLAMQAHEDEIVVMRLIGATKRFVRRPLLYRGIFYGAAGTILAWIITAVILALLRNPTAALASSYQSSFMLHGLSFTQGILMIAAGMLLSLIGARIAASHYLKKCI